MSESHVVSGLRSRRAELAGHIRDLERQVKRHKVNLGHIDATIRLLAPSVEPANIRPKRVYTRGSYFRTGELTKLCQDALRQATGSPVTTAAIAASIMAAKGWPAEDRQLAQVVGNRAGLALRAMQRRGATSKSGEGLKALWALI
jgi:hypothetical protein